MATIFVRYYRTLSVVVKRIRKHRHTHTHTHSHTQAVLMVREGVGYEGRCLEIRWIERRRDTRHDVTRMFSRRRQTNLFRHRKTLLFFMSGLDFFFWFYFSQVLVTYSSTYVLVALSIDRYDAICHPMNFSHGCKWYADVASVRLT